MLALLSQLPQNIISGVHHLTGKSGNMGRYTVTVGRSPNDRKYGVGPGMLKNFGEGVIAYFIASVGSAASVAYGVGCFTGGTALRKSAAISVVGVAISCAIALLVYQVIEEK